MANPPGFEPEPCEVGTRHAAATPRACASGRPGSNGPLPSGAPGLVPLSYIRMEHARLSYGRLKEPPAGFEPAPRPYDGRVLPLTLRRLEVETVGVEPT